MKTTDKNAELRRTPQRKLLAFICEHCRGHELVWQRSGVVAIITQLLMLEGNAHPIIFGEHIMGLKKDKYAEVQRSHEWTCADCGRPLMDRNGRRPTSIEDVVLILETRRRSEPPEVDFAWDLRSPEAIDLLFGLEEEGGDGEGGPADDLNCPKCGHQVFVEMEQALISTPVTMIEGKLRWLHHEKVLVNHWDKHERFYYCANCDFEAPEPFDEWVEAGCPEDVERWLED